MAPEAPPDQRSTVAAFHAIIPARYASTRLPAKALADIAGKPMVVRVAEQAWASGAASVHVATDHADIARACSEHGVAALMTLSEHPTGTDRLAEAARQLAFPDEAIVVNVQGDEPLIPPALIREVALALAAKPAAAIATACHPIEDWSDFHSPHVVKVVADEHGYALYFSRAPIPYPRDLIASAAPGTVRSGGTSSEAVPAGAAPPGAVPSGAPFLRHIGLYAYRAGFLHTYTRLQPVPVEQLEALEQLRALAHGFRIALVRAERAPPSGIDTPADLARVREAFARMPPQN